MFMVGDCLSRIRDYCDLDGRRPPGRAALCRAASARALTWVKPSGACPRSAMETNAACICRQDWRLLQPAPDHGPGKGGSMEDKRRSATRARRWGPAVLLLAPLAQAHPGGLNSEGCHNDRKNGGFHCHLGPAAGRSQPARHTPCARLRPRPHLPAVARTAIAPGRGPPAPLQSGVGNPAMGRISIATTMGWGASRRGRKTGVRVRFLPRTATARTLAGPEIALCPRFFAWAGTREIAL